MGQLPVYYSLGKQADYVEESSSPLFPFGYGLSYTSFRYDALSIQVDDSTVNIRCTVTNTGERDGDEVVQLYLRDDVSSVVTPPIQLKDFRRLGLRKGESKQISFVLNEDDLAFYNLYLVRKAEPGDFTVLIGASASDIRLNGTFRWKGNGER